MQADAGACPRAGRRPDPGAGFNRLYEPTRKPGPIVEAACWSHARRKLYELTELKKAPIAIEAVKRIDALFAIERLMLSKPADELAALSSAAPGS
jgi:transposase